MRNNCLDCGEKVARHWAKRCAKCYHKGRKKPKAYCVDCGKLISKRIYKRCKSCETKRKWREGEIKLPFIGKKHTEATKKKLSEKAKINFKGSGNPRWKGGKEAYYSNLARKMWEQYHGQKIPRNHVIHHRDMNRKNFKRINLACLPAGEHTRYHYRLERYLEE